jgi:hypothetical protein
MSSIYSQRAPDYTVHHRDNCTSGFNMKVDAGYQSNYGRSMEIETHQRYLVPVDFPTSIVQAVANAASKVVLDLIEEFRVLNENPKLLPLRINDPVFKEMVRNKLEGKR